MTRRALLVIVALALIPAARPAPTGTPEHAANSRLPKSLSGPDFLKLSQGLSEPDGSFRSDNLVSNEMFMQRVIPDLVARVKAARAYIGVGPEQNFTYIAAVKPSMAFIIDVRRGNLHLHLMYKALFQLSSDRAEFLSRLFSIAQPAAVGVKSSAQELIAAFSEISSRNEDLYKQNLAAIREHYRRASIPLSAEDLSGIERVYSEFFTRGLAIRYEITPGSAGSFPSYGEVMTATDSEGVARGYLASEENFAAVKDLQARNLIVPVVGNFGGPTAIRAVGAYLRRHGAFVGAFYVSNVEQYLMRDGVLDRFCANAGTLPLDDSSTFIRSERGFFVPRGPRSPSTYRGLGAAFTSQLHNIQEDVRSCGR